MLKDEELVNTIKAICKILEEHNRNDLVDNIIKLFQEYTDLKEELKEFVNMDISSSEEEMDMDGLEDEELIVKVDKKGFHSIK